MNTSRPAKILLVEDNDLMAETFIDFLEDIQDITIEVEHVSLGKKAMDRLAVSPPDIMLLDLNLPDMGGQEILQHVADEGLPVSVIVMTGHGSINVAVEAMRAGAYDFLVKPFNLARLDITLKNALEQRRLARLVETYERDFARNEFHGFIGSSLPMRGIYQIIESAAPSKATVFITGESGTGKEVCAQAIHECSPRNGKPFVALNCAAIPKELMESEIFGHTKGAFTGATAARDGAAKQADGGTLFLDEICEMDPELQSKLLRFVQSGIIQPVGSDKSEKVDVRLVCATNKDPLKAVEAGQFREDLYYRLHVIPIQLPHLRDRGDDVILIANNLLQTFAKEENKDFKRFSPEAEAAIQQYDWPGNVREMQNILRNIVVLHNGQVVNVDHLPAQMTAGAGNTEAPEQSNATQHDTARTLQSNLETTIATRPVDSIQKAGGEILPLWLEEKRIIEDAIATCDGNILKAAALLGVDDSTIYRKRRRWKDMAEGGKTVAFR